MVEKKIIKIDKNGRIIGLTDEIEEFIDKKDIQTIKKKRVSWVVPSNPVLKSVFLLIRKLVSDDSIIAEWTRKWRCKWIVIIDGKTFGSFKNRKEAISFEREFIKKRLKDENSHY